MQNRQYLHGLQNKHIETQFSFGALRERQRMLLKEVSREHADWYVIAKDGNLTAKVSAGLCIGEDGSRLLLLNPTPSEALVKFQVDSWGRLEIQPASDDYILLSPQRNYCNSYKVEPYQGLTLWLPNNALDLANDLQGTTKQRDDLPLTLVPNTQTTRALPNQDQPNAGEYAHENAGESEEISLQPVPEAVVEPIPEAIPGISLGPIAEALPEPDLADYDANEQLSIPVLDSPIERIPEPDPHETLITELPYGFGPRSLNTTQTEVVPIFAERSRGVGKSSSRITLIAAVILVGIAAGLLAAKLELIKNPLQLAEPRTAFNPATPRLVLLSETAPKPVAAPATRDASPTVPAVPEGTPATPATRPLTPAPSGPATPTSVYRTDIADATALFDAGFITAPAERNTVAILNRILEQDPEHPEAISLLKRCADRMIDAAVEAEHHGLEFEARNLVEEVMAFYPQHEQAEDLWQQWTAAQGV